MTSRPRRVATTLLTLAGAIVCGGCGPYKPLRPLVAEYDSLNSRLRVCDSGREYRVITGSEGAAQFLRREREAGAERGEILLGDFRGTFTCLYPWDCIGGPDDTFVVSEVVSLRRARCPSPTAPPAD